MARFATRLRMERIEKDLSPEEMAAALDIEKSEYEAYENGEKIPVVTMLTSIEKLLDVSMDTLLGLGEPPEPTVPHPEAYQLMKSQGRRIAAARSRANIAEDEAAAALSISVQEYHDLEDGAEYMYARTNLLHKLSLLYGVTELYLLLGSDTAPNDTDE